VEFAGQRDATLSASLLALDIVDTVDGLANCELLFGNWGGPEKGGFQHFDRKVLEFGKAIVVRLGSDALFEGRISAITANYPDGGPPQVGICAEDRLQDLRMTRRTRCFTETTLADVVRRIADEHGLQAQPDLNGPRYKILAQSNQSNLAFLRDLARREDAQIWAEGTTLRAVQRTKRNSATVELSWAGTLRAFSVAADLAHQRTSFVAAGWDVAGKQAVKHEANETAIKPELASSDSGPAILRQAFGVRTDTLAHGLPFDGVEARALAEASMRHHSRRFVTGHGAAETTTTLRIGAKLKLSGLGPLFDGDYTMIRLHHRFDMRIGLRTEFACDRASLGSPG
jgi:phage protein D